MILVNDQDRLPWRHGMTIQDVMAAMGWDYVLVAVTINGDFVDPEDYGSRPIPDDADVKVIHIAHGG